MESEKKYVWVVARGEDCEGERIDTIFYDKEKARKHVENIFKINYHTKGWLLVDDTDDIIEWRNSCDYYVAQRHEIEE